MSLFLVITIGIRVLLASLCVGISVLLIRRSFKPKNGVRHYAAAAAWGSLTVAMWWYILANIETWWWQSSLMQTFGLVVWIPATGAAAGYFYVLWVNR